MPQMLKRRASIEWRGSVNTAALAASGLADTRLLELLADSVVERDS